jgi:hypothetical protein
MVNELFKTIAVSLALVSCTTIKQKYEEVADRTFEPILGYGVQPLPGFQAFLKKPVKDFKNYVFVESRVPVKAGRDYLVGSFSGQLKFEKLANRNRLELKKLPALIRYDLWKGMPDFPTWNGARNSKRAEVSEMDILSAAALVPGRFDTFESVGPSGLTVPFYATDIAALLSWFHYEQGKLPAVVAGRCEKGFYSARSALDQNLASGKISRVIYGEEMESIRKSFSCRGLIEAGLFLNVVSFYLGELNRPLIMEKEGHLFIIHGYSLALEQYRTGYYYADMKLNTLSFRGESNLLFKMRLELNTNGSSRRAVWVEGKVPNVIWIPEESSIAGATAEMSQLVKEAIEAKSESNMKKKSNP